MTFYEKIQKRHKLFKILNSFFNSFFKNLRYIFRGHNSQSGKTLIILLHKIGDTVFTIPAVLNLINEIGDQIIVLCYQHSEYIYRLFIPDISCIVVGQEDFYFNRRVAKGIIRKKIKSVNPNLIFDLTGECNSASIIFNSKAHHIAGFNKDIFEGIYDSFSKIETEKNLILRYLNFVEFYFNKKISDEYSFKRKNIEKIENIFIHPFAGWKSKEWGLNKYIEIGTRLSKRFNVNFIFPEDVECKEVLEILKENNIRNHFPDSLPVLIELLRQCDLYIGNDSGPLYLANILGSATFTIYGPTNPRYSVPFGKSHSYVEKKIKCSAGYNSQMCFTNGGREGCPSNECMHLISVDEVQNKLISYIDELNRIVEPNDVNM